MFDPQKSISAKMCVIDMPSETRSRIATVDPSASPLRKRYGDLALYIPPTGKSVLSIVRYLGDVLELTSNGWLVGLEVIDSAWEEGMTDGTVGNRNYFCVDRKKGVFCDIGSLDDTAGCSIESAQKLEQIKHNEDGESFEDTEVGVDDQLTELSNSDIKNEKEFQLSLKKGPSEISQIKNGQTCDYCGFISNNQSDLKTHKTNTHGRLILQYNQYKVPENDTETGLLQTHIDDPISETIETVVETQTFGVKDINLAPETHIGTIIETQGYLNQPVEGKESVLEGWKIKHAKNGPADERKLRKHCVKQLKLTKIQIHQKKAVSQIQKVG